ncbi:P-loop ATPase, Sll1717 family [Streptomyces sp. NPDC085463]|uniref:P-loop ATPase, Sll1717 family n=1 Tax=Streptomyces sp. NPDC085463 TaxID=3365724 RepID=UPI0037D92220
MLKDFSLGQRVAEDEVDELSNYFVETEQWNRVWRGDVDVVYGPKGSGKSAIYSTLVSREDQLFDRGILIRAAESPRGTPAFSALVEDPPLGENEFMGLWKLYFLALIADAFEDYSIKGEDAKRVIRELNDARLRPGGRVSLRAHVRNALDYVRMIVRPREVEPTVEIDPTGGVIGFSTRIQFNEPSAAERAKGGVYIDDLYAAADQALADDDVEIWLLLDRLDVAFAGSPEFEQNALRALFKVYLDLNDLKNVRLKIFLRTDIWKAITNSGFREASHITRELVLKWDRAALLQLVAQRLVRNPGLVEHYSVAPNRVKADTQEQASLFKRVYPLQVEGGPNKPQTFDWCLSRTRDGSKLTAPRELIHLLSETRDVQMKWLEIGETEPEGEPLFQRTALKEALPAVSDVRLTKTLYAEYPHLRNYLEMLEGQKTNHSVQSLATIWNVSQEKAKEVALRLVDVGFFEKRGTFIEPEFWVPFLYRPALGLVQGTAEGVTTEVDDEIEEQA